MAIGASQPLGVRLVWEPDIGHLFGIAHDHVVSKHFHVRDSGNVCPRFDYSPIQGRDPVYLTSQVDRESGERLVRLLQRAPSGTASVIELILAGKRFPTADGG